MPSLRAARQDGRKRLAISTTVALMTGVLKKAHSDFYNNDNAIIKGSKARWKKAPSDFPLRSFNDRCKKGANRLLQR